MDVFFSVNEIVRLKFRLRFFLKELRLKVQDHEKFQS